MREIQTFASQLEIGDTVEWDRARRKVLRKGVVKLLEDDTSATGTPGYMLLELGDERTDVHRIKQERALALADVGTSLVVRTDRPMKLFLEGVQ